MAVRKKMKYSLDEIEDRTTKRPFRYEVFWGTVGVKRSKKVSSMTLAKHPLMTWALDIKSVLRGAGHSQEDRIAVHNLLSEIDNLDDIEGTYTMDLVIESLGMHFQAIVVRLPAPVRV